METPVTPAGSSRATVAGPGPTSRHRLAARPLAPRLGGRPAPAPPGVRAAPPRRRRRRRPVDAARRRAALADARRPQPSTPPDAAPETPAPYAEASVAPAGRASAAATPLPSAQSSRRRRRARSSRRRPSPPADVPLPQQARRRLRHAPVAARLALAEPVAAPGRPPTAMGLPRAETRSRRARGRIAEPEALRRRLRPCDHRGAGHRGRPRPARRCSATCSSAAPPTCT